MPASLVGPAPVVVYQWRSVSNVVIPKENVHPSRIVVNVVSDQSVAPFFLMPDKVALRYRWLPQSSAARNVGGRPAFFVLLAIMLAGASGCATVEDAARNTPKMGESTDRGSLPSKLDQDLSIPNHSASLPVSDPARSTGVSNDSPASVVAEPGFEWKSSDLIVRTSGRLRFGPITPMPEEDAMWAPEIGSLRPPVVRALGDDLAPIRPPLRQSWAYHRTVRPEGYDMELRLPHSVLSASGEHVSPGSLRNTYAGFRDQPLLHPEPGSLPEPRNAKIPQIGPPPPHHAMKTVVGSLTAEFRRRRRLCFCPQFVSLEETTSRTM